MNECGACRQKIEHKGFLHCQSCKGEYHHECLSMEKSYFNSLSKDYLQSWICPACTNSTRRKRNNCNTPVRSNMSAYGDASHDMSFEIDPSPTTSTHAQHAIQSSSLMPGSSSSQSSDPSLTMVNISKMMDEKLDTALSFYMSKLRTALKTDIEIMVRSEINEAVKEIKNDFSATTDYLTAEQNDLKTNIDRQNSVIQSLERENCDVKKQLQIVENKLSNIENLSRSLNIEIQAVPEDRNENVLSLFRKLCEVVNANIDESSVRACRRIAKMNPGSNRPRNILVTLSSPRQRDLVISSVHRYNKSHPDAMLNSTHLGLITHGISRIYVAEHLSPEIKSLHAETRKVAQTKNFKYVWVRYGKIYIRKDDSSSAVQVKNADQLKKITE